MSEKNLKLCRYLTGAAMALSALGTLFNGNIGFDSLGSFASIVFVISFVLMAGAFFSTNAILLGVGCGLRAIYGALYVILYIQWEIGFASILATALDAIGFALLAVVLLKKEEDTQLILIAFVIGAIGSCVGTLFYSGYYDYTLMEKLANCANGISNGIAWYYLPILVGTLTLYGDAIPADGCPIVASPVQGNIGGSLEKITNLKELLDMGAISQEEFEEKKIELLNL